MMAWFFVFFFVSGFCSLVYQVVWLRLAMAAFGVTPPFVSCCPSSWPDSRWVAGAWAGSVGRLEQAEPRCPLRFYALAEAGIGLSALTVPYELAWGRSILAAGSGVAVTAVELVPSVPTLLPFFHADMRPVAIAPRGRIVVDDGRRFLERSGEQYDVITIDPPPPIMAGGWCFFFLHGFYVGAKS